MNEETLAYIKSRITSADVTISGDIETICKTTFDNGMVLEGKSIRAIGGFDAEEAKEAAYQDAVSHIYNGVAFALNKA